MPSHPAGKSPSLKLSPPAILIVIVLVVIAILNQPADEEVDKPLSETSSATPEVTLPEGEPEGEDEKVTSSRPQELPSSTQSRDFLVETSKDVFESPAGLIYRSGSADGHRLAHLMKHAQDNPGKPVHGVFVGKQNEILALLDEVWTLSQERGPPTVKTENQRGRTVITADLKRKVGYVGGQSGKRKGHPACKKVRLVLENKNVITAYPVE